MTKNAGKTGSLLDPSIYACGLMISLHQEAISSLRMIFVLGGASLVRSSPSLDTNLIGEHSKTNVSNSGQCIASEVYPMKEHNQRATLFGYGLANRSVLRRLAGLGCESVISKSEDIDRERCRRFGATSKGRWKSELVLIFLNLGEMESDKSVREGYSLR